ncbi:response regulator transcription factor [Microbacterium sp. M3]|uniref:Response regulator transcription factor n=1 Tax=Microbacterium arthrosphaerae TaxID=792652 RepID=A0ABU4H3A6_9MICO|nr:MULTISPECIES: response regulator transcription factor [Microbacterium]MDW4573822.1 response regulator transcription factor [Microbacterium arthrosphaerae]MDW7607677.1 response regulator transcription factor [Microbacterium sp. M3]
MIRVLLVDDQAMVRAGLRMVLSAEDDVEVVGEASDGAEALRLVNRHRPDVVLLDIRMPGMDGLEAARRLSADAAAPGILMLTTFDEHEIVDEALSLGVAGFLLKASSPEQLVDAVRAVAAGSGVLDPAITRHVIDRFADAPRADPRAAAALADLSPREVDVLRLVAAGRSNAEIASVLFLGEATVKTHVSRMLLKLGLRDRVQAVAFAYESGLLTPGG